jgi:hypothetical protein
MTTITRIATGTGRTETPKLGTGSAKVTHLENSIRIRSKTYAVDEETQVQALVPLPLERSLVTREVSES